MSSDPQTQINKTLETSQQNQKTSGLSFPPTPLKVIWKILEMLKKKGQEGTPEYLSHQEKLLYFHIKAVEGGSLDSAEQTPYDFTQELQSFIQKSNSTAMQMFQNKQTQQDGANLIIKSIDMLMQKQIHHYVQPIQTLGELKVLTFNNLAVVYQERKQFQFALKAIHYASAIEQKLVQDSYKDSKFNILGTLMNKAAIQSSLQRHDKALQTLVQTIKQIEVLEYQIQRQKEQNGQEQQQEDGQENKEEGEKIQKEEIKEEQIQQVQYMKLIAHYNAGAENEHLFHRDKAKLHYNTALRIANNVGDNEMIDRINQALD